eukprot:scaffold13874_cov63-Phaeocystis_antarctica.AAC.6
MGNTAVTTLTELHRWEGLLRAPARYDQCVAKALGNNLPVFIHIGGANQIAGEASAVEVLERVVLRVHHCLQEGPEDALDKVLRDPVGVRCLSMQHCEEAHCMPGVRNVIIAVLLGAHAWARLHVGAVLPRARSGACGDHVVGQQARAALYHGLQFRPEGIPAHQPTERPCCERPVDELDGLTQVVSGGSRHNPVIVSLWQVEAIKLARLQRPSAPAIRPGVVWKGHHAIARVQEAGVA